MNKLFNNKFIIPFLLVFSFSFCYSLTLTEEKTNLEKSIQSRAEEIIQKILGNKNFIVLVSIEIKTPEQTPASSIDLSKQTYQRRRIFAWSNLFIFTYYKPSDKPSNAACN
jgi:hypothetical protein